MVFGYTKTTLGLKVSAPSGNHNTNCAMVKCNADSSRNGTAWTDLIAVPARRIATGNRRLPVLRAKVKFASQQFAKDACSKTSISPLGNRA
jgi:hypothetical protein